MGAGRLKKPGKILPKKIKLIKIIKSIIFFNHQGFIMEIISASDAKREFGEVILKAQQGPVGINKNGKPAAVMISASAYEEFQALQHQVLKLQIQVGLDDIDAGRVLEGDKVIGALNQQIADAKL